MQGSPEEAVSELTVSATLGVHAVLVYDGELSAEKRRNKCVAGAKNICTYIWCGAAGAERMRDMAPQAPEKNTKNGTTAQAQVSARMTKSTTTFLED